MRLTKTHELGFEVWKTLHFKCFCSVFSLPVVENFLLDKCLEGLFGWGISKEEEWGGEGILVAELAD